MSAAVTSSAGTTQLCWITVMTEVKHGGYWRTLVTKLTSVTDVIRKGPYTTQAHTVTGKRSWYPLRRSWLCSRLILSFLYMYFRNHIDCLFKVTCFVLLIWFSAVFVYNMANQFTLHGKLLILWLHFLSGEKRCQFLKKLECTLCQEAFIVKFQLKF
jgi:hypothetical protein